MPLATMVLNTQTQRAPLARQALPLLHLLVAVLLLLPRLPLALVGEQHLPPSP